MANEMMADAARIGRGPPAEAARIDCASDPAAK